MPPKNPSNEPETPLNEPEASADEPQSLPPKAPSNELRNRIIFGALAAVVAAVAVDIGGYAWYFLVGVLSLIASLEFDRMRGDGKICFLFCLVPILASKIPAVAIVMVAMAIGFVIVLQKTAKRYYPWLIISIPYISIPAVALIWLRDQPNGLYLVAWLVLVIVTTDTAAYFTGKKFGRHLLAPTISPKKTWEGFAGGAVAASIVSFIFSGDASFILQGLVISIVGQISDLMESSIKRNFGVKDSGKFLPGHGGAMDRLDSLVLTSPLAALAVYYEVVTW